MVFQLCAGMLGNELGGVAAQARLFDILLAPKGKSDDEEEEEEEDEEDDDDDFEDEDYEDDDFDEEEEEDDSAEEDSAEDDDLEEEYDDDEDYEPEGHRHHEDGNDDARRELEPLVVSLPESGLLRAGLIVVRFVADRVEEGHPFFAGVGHRCSSSDRVNQMLLYYSRNRARDKRSEC